MALYRFIGDDGDGPEIMVAFGLTFPKGEAVRVADEKTIFKLSGNSHFEKVTAPEPAKRKTRRGDSV